jgi:hypothetical protein
MTGKRMSWRSGALYLLAAAWPWEVYGLLPGIYVPLSVISALALAGGLVADVVRHGRPKIPFDLLWPTLLLALLPLLAFVLGEQPLTLDLFVGGVAFLAVVHTAQRRGTVLRALRLTVFSTVAVALISLAAKTGAPVPTAFSPVSGAALSFARELSGGVLTLVLGGGLAFALAFTPVSRLRRWGYIVAGLLPLSVLALIGVQTLASPSAWMLASHPALPLFPLLAGVLALWLGARICGRLVVSRLEDAPGIQMGLLTVTLGAALTGLACGILPGHGALATLGLIGAYAVPRWKGLRPAEADMESRTVLVSSALIPLAVAGLGILNIAFVFENNPRDPRNYAHLAAELISEGRYATLEARMDFLDRAVPGERRTHWWRAQARLRQNDLEGAAAAFRAALQPGSPRLLAPPAASEIEAFLGRMRDAVSAQPPEARGLAYERALMAAGRPDQALASLRVRGNGGADLPPMPALGRVLAAMLGAPETALELSEWPGGELARVFVSLGADVEHAPAGFPPDCLPLALRARADADSVCVEVWAGGAHYGGDWRIADTSPQASRTGSLYWGPFRRAGGGEWMTTLGPDMIAELRFGGEPSLDFNRAAGRPVPGEVLRVRIP